MEHNTYSLSCHHDRDADVIAVLNFQENLSAYLRNAVRFYERHRNGLPRDELAARLKAIEEQLGRLKALPAGAEVISDEAIYHQLDGILSQIESGEFE